MEVRPYRLVVLGTDADWGDEVAACCRRLTRDVLDDAQAVAIDDSVGAGSAEESQILAVLLADETSCRDPTIHEQVRKALARSIPVLPVVRAGADVPSVLPPAVRHVNAVPWERDGRQAMNQALQQLGLSERRCRLFVSYRRRDSEPLALQLRDHLSRRRFDVFLDRFSIRPADDVQHRITVELTNMAFVLLLESPTAAVSRWVQYETTYALRHQLPILALSLPGLRGEERIATVDDAYRVGLRADDFTADVLTEEALAGVLDEVEIRHARQLRSRRRSALGSLQNLLDRAGYRWTPLPDPWALLAERPDGSHAVYLVTPRPPVPADLHVLDRLRVSQDEVHPDVVEGFLVSSTTMRDSDDWELITWIPHRRPLFVHDHGTVRETLGLT